MAFFETSRWVQFFRYGVTGTLTTLLDLLTFQVFFYQIHCSQNVSVVAAFVVALCFSFFVNRFWTFRSNFTDQEWSLSQFLKFAFVASVGLGLSLVVMIFFTQVLFVEPLWAKLLTSGVVLFWNFTVNSFWTFSASEETEVIKPLLPEKGPFRYELSIIIPAFNESKRLPETLESALQYFERLNILFEIIVVDDGSSDDTAVLAQNILSAPHKIIQLSENKGKGFAVKTGVLEAEGRYILFCDADEATPFSEYHKLREAMLFSHIAIGSRYKNRESVQKKQPWYRIMFSRAVNLMAQIFLIEGIKDTQCGFKLFRSDIGKRSFAVQRVERFAFDIEFLMLAKNNGARICEISVQWYDQPGSTFGGWRDGMRALKDFFRIKFYMMFGFYDPEKSA